MSELQLVADRWEGTRVNEERKDSPTLEDFDRALSDLDAHTHTMISLKLDERSLGIGGGKGQYVVVYDILHPWETWTVVNTNSKEGAIMLTVGGQLGDYPAKYVINKEEARQAGVYFLRNGSRDPNLLWERG